MDIVIHQEVATLERRPNSIIRTVQSRTVLMTTDGPPDDSDDDAVRIIECVDCGEGHIVCRCSPGEG